MPLQQELLELLRCPITGETLALSSHTLVSKESGKNYPLIDGIPWLLANPQNSLLDWSAKLNHFHQVIAEEINELEHALDRVSGKTHQRLEQLLIAKRSFLHTVFDLMSPVVRSPMAGKASYDALRDRAPSTQNLLSYEANLYRDWVWGDKENQLSQQIVEANFTRDFAGKLIVLGAGAGRLAWDLHQAIKPELTIASDINPLLVLAAHRIVADEGLSIYEFPSQPRNIESTAVYHNIRGENASDNFYFMFSNALEPAFKRACFNAVVTPWLIDIQPFELSRFIQQLNHYVPLGGQWINFGSLVFNQSRDAFCYSIEEVQDIALAKGFEISTVQEHQIPYLQSPHNAGYRMEHIWSWSATKVADVAPLTDTQVLPSWLLDTQQPVPKSAYVQQFALTHRTYAQLAAEVDGRTSLNKIANKLAGQQQINPEEALSLVTQLFVDLYEQNH
ncbi:MAG: hypothetical protein AAFZ92_06805 [Pseudomonadota bacterium]